MKQLIMAVLAVSILTGLAFAQPRPDSCRIYIWDNDAGECAQEYPATSMERHLAHYTAWADMRDGNWNIYGQMTTFEGEPLTDNVRLNKFVDALNGAQKNPDISGVDANDHFAVVWQDSFEGGWRIRGRLFAPYFEPLSNSEFDCSYPSAYPKFRPRVAMNRASGMFVVVWAQYNSLTDSDVYAILLNPDGHPATDTVLVSEPSLRHQRRPSVCFSNAGIVVVWEDWRNGTFPGKPVIWAQKFDPDLHRDGVNYPISNIEYWAEYPDVSMDATENASDYYVVTWHSRQGGRNVRAARFDWSGMIDQEIQINPATLTRSYFPTVTTCVNGDFVVAWQDSFSYDAGVQTFVRYADRLGSLRNCLLVNDNEPRLQGYPSVASFGGRFSISWFDSLRLTGRGDIYGQNFVLNSDFDGDTIAKFGGNYRIDNIGPQGRKVWYHPKKNYDNPLTTDWDEDPIVEPDSIKIPLDSAFVLAFAERNNIPGQRFVRITNSDILAEGFYTQGKGSTDGYDVCVLDLGYATPALSAGEISRAQQDSLLKFADNGGAFLCSGNDFGEMYGSSRLFNCFGAQYLGPGHSTGNIDSMGGTHAMTDGMLFHYPYGRDEDNSVDYIVPDSSGCSSIFEGDPAKWARCCATFYSSYFKGSKASWHRRNIYLPFAMGALSSDGVYPNTQDELSRRILAYQGFNVEPAPIIDLRLATSATEGRVDLSWTAVSDDGITDPASTYQLKYSWYNAGASDLGKLSSESDYQDNGFVYNYIWGTPLAPGVAESEPLRGFPPGDTLIFALKAGDESSPTRWGELGAEPRIVVSGDRVTPHSIGMGYGMGCVRDFISTERIDDRWGDTLFCTWNTSSIYFGYRGCDWRTGGDLLIYMDTHAGGADSTYDHNGSGIKSGFDAGHDFKPDYCLVFDDGATYTIKKWNTDSNKWKDTITTSSSTYLSLDSINHYEYTELRVLFSFIGSYITTDNFRYLVVAQQESGNDPINVFPTANKLTKDAKAPVRYPYYYQVTGGLRSVLEPRAVTSPLAVELSEFSALEQSGTVTLSWRTESETDNYQWLIDRSLEPNANYQRIAIVPGQGSSPTGHTYTYVDNTVLPNLTYYYLLGDQDFQDNVTWHGPVTVTTGGQSITKVSLLPCQPNPACGSANIRYAIPEVGRVSLRVYDICGRLVRVLRDEVQQPGRYAVPWDGLDTDGRKVATGVYFSRLETGKNYLTQIFTLIR